MSVPAENSTPMMQIRCPGCAQKFSVQCELRGKTVECGKCALHFSIDDQVITKVGRVFPGEKRRGDLRHFGKVAPTGTPGVPAATALPKVVPAPGISILRLFVGLLGAGIILAVATLFFLELPWGPGTLDLVGRFAVVGAAAALATLCFVLANPGNRKRALLLGSVGLVVVLALPLAVPLPGGATVLDVGLPAAVEAREQTADEALAEMGYVAVERTRDEVRASGGEEAAGQVMAVWLRGVKEVAKVELKDYLIRVSGAEEISHLYPRQNGDFLMILQGTRISFASLQQQCVRLGPLGRVFAAEQAIEVMVAELPSSEDPSAELANPADSGFYALNLRELESLDLNRAGRAAERLARVAPEKFRPDILRRLVMLLSEGDAQFKGRIAAALCVWAEPGEAAAAEAAMRAVDSLLLSESKQVPESLVGFLLLMQDPAILPVLDALWRADPLKWEKSYADGGALAEPTLLASFQSTDGPLRKSALFILAKIGSAKSLMVLRAALPLESDEDLLLAMKKAIAAIEERTP